MATLRTVVDALTSTVDYLRVSIDAPDGEWLDCGPLLADPDALAAVVATTKEAQGTDRDDVAMSLFVQGYVFSVAAVCIGAWLLDDVVVDAVPEGWAIALGRGRPSAVNLTADVPVAPAQNVGEIHASLIDGHLGALVDAAHDSCRVGAALLWGNVAGSCASAFAAFADSRPGVGDRATEFFAAARPEVHDAGRIVRVGERFAWERRSCCLWYRTDGGFLCEDCSLRPAAEHEARYAAMAEADV